MNRILELLFGGKRPVNVSAAIGAVRVEPQRKKLEVKLHEIDQSYDKINKEAKKMKKSIDTALAIAMSTGGLR